MALSFSGTMSPSPSRYVKLKSHSLQNHLYTEHSSSLFLKSDFKLNLVTVLLGSARAEGGFLPRHNAGNRRDPPSSQVSIKTAGTTPYN